MPKPKNRFRDDFGMPELPSLRTRSSSSAVALGLTPASSRSRAKVAVKYAGESTGSFRAAAIRKAESESRDDAFVRLATNHGTLCVLFHSPNAPSNEPGEKSS